MSIYLDRGIQVQAVYTGYLLFISQYNMQAKVTLNSKLFLSS